MTDQVEGSFHVLVLAPLRASEEHATNDGWTAPLRFNRADFDEAMATVAPGIEIEIDVGGRTQRTNHSFRAMKSFRPDVLMDQASVLRALRAGASNVPPPMTPTTGHTPSPIDDILSVSEPPPANALEATLAAFIQHPEVRALERAWRGLHLLADRAEKSIVIEAMNASADDVGSVLEKLARRVDTTPIDLIVVDHAVGSSSRDLARLETWATLAEGLGAPLVANGLPELLGADDLKALGGSQSRLRSSDDSRSAAFRAAAAKDVMRWASLALNGPLARPRHVGPVKRTFGVVFDETLELYIGSAIGVAALAIESFAKSGWAIPTAGVLRGLPVHIVDGESIATEARTTSDAAAEAAQAGVALFCSASNDDVAVLSGVPSVHRAPSTQGGAAAAATHSLDDQLFIARVTHAIIQIAAAIPASTSEDAVRDVVKVALGELFGEAGNRPELDVKITGAPACLEVTIRPRGFLGLKLEEAILGAPLAS